MIAALAPVMTSLVPQTGDAPAPGGGFDALLASLAPVDVPTDPGVDLTVANGPPVPVISGVTAPDATATAADAIDDADTGTDDDHPTACETRDDASQAPLPPLPAPPQAVLPAVRAVIRPDVSSARIIPASAGVDQGDAGPAGRLVRDGMHLAIADPFASTDVVGGASAGDAAASLAPAVTLPTPAQTPRIGSTLASVRRATVTTIASDTGRDADTVNPADAEEPPSAPERSIVVAIPDDRATATAVFGPLAAASPASPPVFVAPTSAPSPGGTTFAALPRQLANAPSPRDALGAPLTASPEDRAPASDDGSPNPKATARDAPAAPVISRAQSSTAAGARPVDMAALLAGTAMPAGGEATDVAGTPPTVVISPAIVAGGAAAATAPRAVAMPSAPSGPAAAATIQATPNVAPVDRARLRGTAGAEAAIAPTVANDAPAADGIDLDAIFPLAGDAPLNVSFVRAPAAAATPVSLPQPSVMRPAVAGDVADRGAAILENMRAVESDGVDGGSSIPAVPTGVVAAAPPAQPVAPAAPATGSAAAPTEVSVQHHLDVAHDGVWLDRLAKDIAASADSQSHMRFQLNPERLGALQVDIKRDGDAASVRFTAGSEAARGLIADAQPKLVEQARAHGMTITDTRVDVSQQQGGYGSQGGGQSAAFAQQQQQSGGQRAPLFDRPAAAMTRSATAGLAEQTPARAERYA